MPTLRVRTGVEHALIAGELRYRAIAELHDSKGNKLVYEGEWFDDEASIKAQLDGLRAHVIEMMRNKLP